MRGLTLVCTLAAVGATAPAKAAIFSVRAEGLVLVNTDSTGYLASIADGSPTIPLDFTVYYRSRAIMPDFVDGDYLARSYAHKASFGNYVVPFTRSAGLLTQSDQQSAMEYRGGNQDLGLGFLVRLNSNLTSEGSFSNFNGFAETYARPALSLGAFPYGPLQRLTITNLGSGAGAVPEPGTWLMLLIGFGVLGRVSRRRKAALA